MCLARLAAFACTLALFAACMQTPSGPGEVVTSPMATRDGLAGRDGARGAARTSFLAQARIIEALPIEVFFPSRADGTLDPIGAPYPALVFVQGNGVATARYHWLAAHLATRGYVVLMPEHPFDDAVFESSNAIIALRATRDIVDEAGTLRGAIDPSAAAGIIGHSIGAVVAAQQWIDHTEFGALCMLAGRPAVDDDLTSRAPSPVLAIAGAADVLSPPTAVENGTLRFAGMRTFALVQGTSASGALSHYAWTDDPTDDERVADGPRPRDLAAVRVMALAVLDTWLDASLRNDAEARARLTRREFNGVAIRP